MPPMQKLQLPDVTLVAVDTVCHELAAMAVQQCVHACKFGDVHIHTDRDFKQFHHLGKIFDTWHRLRSVAQVMGYLWREVPKFIRTSHALVIQWDSGVIDPSAWTDEFLQYHYIGAPWGWFHDGHNVGNGGFSLRSRKLMDHIAQHLQMVAHIPEDAAICRQYRPHLEAEGFRFAPLELASRFSVERTIAKGADRHFGYHGVFNWPRVLAKHDMQRRMKLVEASEYLRGKDEVAEVRSLIA